MFGTGLDVTLAQSLLPKEKVSFGYYDGHYTTMWYSAFRNSLLPSGIKPKVVIWGFRPTFAMLPAYRQNAVTELEKFYDPNDPVFAAILEKAGAGEAMAPDEKPKGFFAWLAEKAPVATRRTDLKDALNGKLGDALANAFRENNESAKG